MNFSFFDEGEVDKGEERACEMQDERFSYHACAHNRLPRFVD